MSKKIQNIRKNIYKKQLGYSRYDSNSNVIYSESLGSEGQIIKHYYDYDDSNRRIFYEERDDTNNSIYSEYKDYYSNNDIKSIIAVRTGSSYNLSIKEYNHLGGIENEVRENNNNTILHISKRQTICRYSPFTYNKEGI